MAVNVRRCNKRVTDPFNNEEVRARIFSSIGSTSSSGSEHDAETDIVSSSSSSHSISSSSTSSTSTSLCLSHLVQNFLECGSNSPSNTTTTTTTTTSDKIETRYSSDSDSEDFLHSDPTAMIRDVIVPIIWNNADPFRNHLISHVTKAIEIFSFFRDKTRSIFNRNLMAYLRQIGYNAGICKTKWDASAGGTLTAGNYEFIDVICPNSTARYVIDAEFSGEFEIARETSNYKKLRSSLPRVFVGKVEDLNKMIRLMCDEARRSMKINGLTLPPWRRNRYMQIKWLGKYRRTTNCLPAAPVSSSAVGTNFAVKCRSVGFDVSGDSGRFVYPPVARTR
ncbi:hypothetical protein BVRB_7g168290 [Beta vulgaris subsp. vulgaris]|uniref:Uncharacterized protein n=1 Tax=Beta vulgaris subsp. vulgaris TaxID=3555 RepID=A0A0J8ER94_BETVV|nr:hypothetical protein BVRB_7g168290 [Beta vulgaris subsp. vulgaris]